MGSSSVQSPAVLMQSDGASKIGRGGSNVADDLAALEAALLLKAALASPAFTGTPTAPTGVPGNSDSRLATTAFVQQELGALVGGSPGALDTLNELAAALGDDANFAATVTNALALKAALASPAFTGNPTVPTQPAASNNTRIASTAYVKGELDALDGAGLVLLAPQVEASNDLAVEIVLPSGYDEYELRMIDVIPANDIQALQLRTSTNGGSIFDSGAADYTFARGNNSGSTFSVTSVASFASLQLASGVGSAAGENGVSGVLRIGNPSAAAPTGVHFSGGCIDTLGRQSFINFNGKRKASSDVDAIQLTFTAGNIESGKFALYGIKR